ncbi:hypothetical protein UFOVP1346_51 [uncultured Caudovirales phage]|uniref:Uncharacterized protein n=1 Tax=uncultured Caudovirales phage TaxID=2100421 RepID=A0A6J5R6B4_9CAUD|nr:hypothetical protein UFOVP921_31 [uncultured Caudovirales phage]CAB4187244.1 hypothetical protein UFOVP1156_7 [uncultured Caudovirales phage]CAB4200616.1 hypothetical protein UFOVP1346_51 [uncultured Caudovirales phage]
MSNQKVITEAAELQMAIEELYARFDIILGIAILTVDDLDSRRTRDDFSESAVSNRMLMAGLESLREQSRPGCSCHSCTDDTCPITEED